jgi:hypothetical protein
MMEAYLEMPCGPQAFLFPSNPPWGIHIHDRVVGNGAWQEGPVTNLKKVIYLHRDPIDVIFSQLKYEGNNMVTEDHVESLIEEYAAHLQRWRIDNTDIESILDITYEKIKQDAQSALAGAITFLGYEINEQKIAAICSRVDKGLTKKMTPHDPNALSDQSLLAPNEYARQREEFSTLFVDRISKRFAGLR